MLQKGDTSIVEKSVEGTYHFNGSFNNADSLKTALSQLQDEEYSELVEKDRKLLLSIFEEIFDRKSFTGRWEHFMVTKDWALFIGIWSPSCY